MATVTREQLQSIEWAGCVGPDSEPGCPECSAEAYRFEGPNRSGRFVGDHAPDCWIAAALAAPPAEDGTAIGDLVEFGDPDDPPQFRKITTRWETELPNWLRAPLRAIYAPKRAAQAPPAEDATPDSERATTPLGEQTWTTKQLVESVLHGIKSAREQWVCPHCERQSAPPASDPPGLREALETVLASAHPHPEHHPAMSRAWAHAREVLAAYPLPASPQAETKGDE